MKAHYLNTRERKTAAALAEKMIKENEHDVARRAQYLWMVSMLWAGLAPRTVMRVINELDKVTEYYSEKRADGCGDFALVKYLDEHGIAVDMTKYEA